MSTAYKYVEPSLADELSAFFGSALDAATLGQASTLIDALRADPAASARLRTMKQEMSPGANRSLEAEAFGGIDNAITFGVGSVALNGGQANQMMPPGALGAVSGAAGQKLKKA